MESSSQQKSSVNISTEKSGLSLLLKIEGQLDANSVPKIWDDTLDIVRTNSSKNITIDASKLTYCDTSGISLFVKICKIQEKKGAEFEIINLSDEFRQLFDLYTAEEIVPKEAEAIEQMNFIEHLGKDFLNFKEDIYSYIEFIGEMIVALFLSLLNPTKIKWKTVFKTAEKVGVNAIVIIAMSNFLVGLIMAFQAAIPMKEFGAEFFVSDLVVLSTFRELGPLITAIIINGRSGSAFAAEIGTMKVNEEVDALTTMGLDPVRFLVTPKVIAAMFMFPLLTLVGNLFAVIGGGIVVKLLGYTFIAYFNEITSVATYSDLLGGLLKSFFFALIIAGIGCKKGLETKTGASAVGDSTTSAVVSGLVLLIVADGIFGVIYFYLGI